ncbi:hypothetical protein DXT76_10845 [Halobacillus trueperi]|uniref:Uncharacterized protein n=1 Tax=Halobacillus trueperi TaxID=156205 RepID=A0A3D8VN86_9BACI|nr:hypothetical protein [Halobacillus trueperi]RDY70874.1 hypothetical protein DXT76_10845 [Halobacillus trueperi]
MESKERRLAKMDFNDYALLVADALMMVQDEGKSVEEAAEITGLYVDTVQKFVDLLDSYKNS